MPELYSLVITLGVTLYDLHASPQIRPPLVAFALELSIEKALPFQCGKIIRKVEQVVARNELCYKQRRAVSKEKEQNSSGKTVHSEADTAPVSIRFALFVSL